MPSIAGLINNEEFSVFFSGDGRPLQRRSMRILVFSTIHSPVWPRRSGLTSLLDPVGITTHGGTLEVPESSNETIPSDWRPGQAVKPLAERVDLAAAIGAADRDRFEQILAQLRLHLEKQQQANLVMYLYHRL